MPRQTAANSRYHHRHHHHHQYRRRRHKQGPILGRSSADLPSTSNTASFTFSQGVVSNTNYLVYLIAKDAYDNCMPTYRPVTIRTDDDIAPLLLASNVRCASVAGFLAPTTSCLCSMRPCSGLLQF